jgi:hypothetical protein
LDILIECWSQSTEAQVDRQDTPEIGNPRRFHVLKHAGEQQIVSHCLL